MSANRWLWLGVPLVGITELVAHTHFRDAAPTDSEWDQLAEAVKQHHQAADLVVAAPYWAEPHLRARLGDTLMTLADVARADDSTYKRALEVNLFDSPSSLVGGGHGRGWVAWRTGEQTTGWELVEKHRVAGFRIDVLQNPQAESVLLDFVDKLGPERTQVHRGSGGSAKPCPWSKKAKVSNGALHGHPTFPRRRFECGSDEQFVGVTTIEDQFYKPRRCIWAHPSSRRDLTIRFEAVPLGGSLKGHAGLPWFLERETHGTPVQLEVRVGTETLGNYVHEDGEGWKPFSFDTEAWRGQELPVTFVVSSRNARKREFCFQADTRE